MLKIFSIKYKGNSIFEPEVHLNSDTGLDPVEATQNIVGCGATGIHGREETEIQSKCLLALGICDYLNLSEQCKRTEEKMIRVKWRTRILSRESELD